jgi:hypothetical protein
VHDPTLAASSRRPLGRPSLRKGRAASIVEIASVASTLLPAKSKRVRWAIGYGHLAAASGALAAFALLLLVLFELKPIRVLAGALTALSLLAMLASLSAYALLRWRPAAEARLPEPVAAPPTGISSMSKEARVVLALGGVVLVGVSGLGAWLLAAATKELGRAPTPPPSVSMVAEPPPEQRADHRLRRDGHVSVSGGVLYVPPSFRSHDGAFDLVMHFHGNTKLVQESIEAAKVNAFVYIVNLGTGSGPYEEHYSVPGVFDQILQRIQEAAEKRGLRDARLGRVALSSWSAGYGAVAKIIDSKKNFERVDALLMMDGLHVAFLDQKNKTGLDSLRLQPFIRFAREAADGKKLFTITHSEIKTEDYASASETADALIRATDAERSPAAEAPPKVSLPSMAGVWSKDAERWLEQKTEAKKGGFHVRSYVGQTPEHHMAHLVQMSVTVLPELAERWKGTADADPRHVDK